MRAMARNLAGCPSIGQLARKSPHRAPVHYPAPGRADAPQARVEAAHLAKDVAWLSAAHAEAELSRSALRSQVRPPSYTPGLAPALCMPTRQCCASWPRLARGSRPPLTTPTHGRDAPTPLFCLAVIPRLCAVQCDQLDGSLSREQHAHQLSVAKYADALEAR